MRCWALTAVSLLGACAAGDEPGPAVPGLDAGMPRVDTAVVPEEVPFDVAIGTGSRGLFIPHEQGATLPLQRGCQGSQHIFTSVRILGAATGLVRVRVDIVRADDDAGVSVPIDVRLTPEPDSLSDLASRVTGLTPVVEVPRDVLGAEAIVRVSVEDESGALDTAEMRGVVAWGPDSCGAH